MPGIADFFQSAIQHVDDLFSQIQNHSANSNNIEKTGTPIDAIIEGLQQIPNTNYGQLSGFNPSQIIQQILSAYKNGDFRSIQGYLGQLPSNIVINPEWTKYLDNMIANQNTGEARAWEEEQSSSNLLKAGNQLEQLGLSSSGVLQTGGSNVNGVSAANNSMTNLAQQNKLAKYNQKMAMARQILSMTSSMASAGIYGHAIGAAKKAAGVVTSNAAHSAYGALTGLSRQYKYSKSREQILAELANPEDLESQF